MEIQPDDVAEYATLRDGDFRTLVQRLQAEQLRKLDLVVPAGSVEMDTDANINVQLTTATEDDELSNLLASVQVDIANQDRSLYTFEPLPFAHGTIADRTGIPRRYYRRLEHEDDTQAQAVLSENVNYWLGQAAASPQPPSFLLRTFAPTEPGGIGTLRAVLSNKYNALDNLDLVTAALRTTKNMGLNLDVGSCNLSESKMYVVLNARDVSIDGARLLSNYRNPNTGDGGEKRIYAGIVLSNSEVGAGAHAITPRPFADCCMNAFTIKQHRLRKTHLGTRLDEGAVEWSDTTRRKNVELVTAQLEDAVSQFLTTDYLESILDHYGEAAETEVRRPVDVIRVVSNELGFSDEEQQEVLNHYMKAGDSSALGVVQAVTFFAQAHGDADSQFMIEAEAGDIVQTAVRTARLHLN